ncbi:MAG: thioredoxin family protein [Anaerolineales bacterium]
MGEWFEIIESYLRAYSVWWIGALFLGIAAFSLFRRQRTFGEWIAFGTLVAILLVAWMVLHPRPSRLSADAARVVEQIGQGTPVLLEFQSPFCMSCVLLRPLVDEIEQKYHGRLIVIRVNIQSASGRELTRHFGFKYTPTFIFFDAQGQERWRSVGFLSPSQVEESLSTP